MNAIPLLLDSKKKTELQGKFNCLLILQDGSYKECWAYSVQENLFLVSLLIQQLFVEGEVNIGEYSPMFTSPSTKIRLKECFLKGRYF